MRKPSSAAVVCRHHQLRQPVRVPGAPGLTSVAEQGALQSLAQQPPIHVNPRLLTCRGLAAACDTCGPTSGPTQTHVLQDYPGHPIRKAAARPGQPCVARPGPHPTSTKRRAGKPHDTNTQVFTCSLQSMHSMCQLYASMLNGTQSHTATSRLSCPAGTSWSEVHLDASQTSPHVLPNMPPIGDGLPRLSTPGSTGTTHGCSGRGKAKTLMWSRIQILCPCLCRTVEAKV